MGMGPWTRQLLASPCRGWARSGVLCGELGLSPLGVRGTPRLTSVGAGSVDWKGTVLGLWVVI